MSHGVASLSDRLGSAARGEGSKILIVEDDERLRTYLRDNLAADGYAVVEARGVREALARAEIHHPDLVLLDLVLGDEDGLRLLDAVRGAEAAAQGIDPGLPIVVVSGRGSEPERVRGLNRGADDYLTKPFGYQELLARVRAVLRRSVERPREGLIAYRELRIDPVRRAVTLAGRPVALTAKEFALLTALAREPERVFTKEELLRDVWGFRSPGRTRTLDAHACRLRAKLSGSPRRWVSNVRGIGYRLVERC
ncbi:DNA-binding response regulator, OmpR family, contains REC and winged-helix (wHTH) domain [Thermoleophilum album]|uniref:DNA-binding response regulator, OmpR family, contains REC and winged-helix (WHTH) domain n=1 Tax=Thermoleophilum album TaxID=29539 RepID=A0A1H6FYX3_THEAL|nr:DNA-binding response regulator, OmpR family, contains REC and winged-helix (wHTH) domain [Thermoleophilum album]